MSQEPTNTQLLQSIDRLGQAVTELSVRSDKQTAILVNLQYDMGGVKKRLDKLEETAVKVYNKIDEFIGIIRKQEAETAALGLRVERLEERIQKLELSRGLAAA